MRGPSALADHFLLLVLLAAIVSTFLALLWRDGAADRRRLFGRVFLALVGSAVAIGWVLLALGRHGGRP
ncbi:MAG: hypothetical protein DYH06_23210 [Acidobacteria bacterium ACB2]|nr:hypothetical protein [Acidobacteria bacterium ACB2]